MSIGRATKLGRHGGGGGGGGVNAGQVKSINVFWLNIRVMNVPTNELCRVETKSPPPAAPPRASPRRLFITIIYNKLYLDVYIEFIF